MPGFEYDLRFLRASVEQLEAYLLSKELYWPLGIGAPAGEPSYPQLTLGWLLLAQRRASVTALPGVQEAELERWRVQLEATRVRWRIAWEQKARWELRARLNLWRNFIEEYRAAPEANYDRYAYEVGRRVMAGLLAKEVGEIPHADEEMLAGLDKILRASLVTGEFIWEAGLQDGFPREEFWFLYGRLPSM
jgi:hypothetical protein